MQLNQLHPFDITKNFDSLSIFIFYEFIHIFLGIYLITWVAYIPVSAFQKIHPLLVLLEMATPDLLGCASFVPTYSLYNNIIHVFSVNWICKKRDTWLLSHFILLASLLKPKYNTISRPESYSFPFPDFRQSIKLICQKEKEYRISTVVIWIVMLVVR
jgi:hypothetical protein